MRVDALVITFHDMSRMCVCACARVCVSKLASALYLLKRARIYVKFEGIGLRTNYDSPAKFWENIIYILCTLKKC